MQLEEFMTIHGITSWDSERTSRKGNRALSVVQSVRTEYDGFGEAEQYGYFVVVNPHTNTIVHHEVDLLDSWTY